MRVAVVGAFGTVGTAILDHLDRDEHRVTALDVAEHPDYDGTIVDARSADDLAGSFAGHDAVVHLARGPFEDQDGLFDNLRMCHAVLDAVRQTGVETVVYASTNHVVGTYEEELAPEIYYPGHDVTIDHTDPIRPDSQYAVEKAYGEALGRYAVDHEPRPERFFAIRIGTIRREPRDHPFCMAEEGVERGDWERDSEAYDEMVARVRATWQSRRDFAHMIDRCVRTEHAGFEVFYGVSDNDRRWLDIEHARSTIGYDPQDNGEEWEENPAGPSN